MKHRKLVAENIREQRKRNGLTQEDLARLSGITSQHLSKIERCRCSPSLDTFVQIADALSINPSELFAGYKPGAGDR